MEREKQKAVLEAILFTMGDSVPATKLAEVVEADVEEVKELLKQLQEEYQAADKGIALLELEDSYQMCTKADMYEYLLKIAKSPRKYVLTETVLETLSIVAYKQPVTRLEIEKIRGVSCDHAVNKLIEYELIHEVGRLDAPGRPLLFGTTEQFLRSFGVKSLEELPELNVERMEEFRRQAEEEAMMQQAESKKVLVDI